ncbi:LysR family transcriptional regulator [Pseudooceanicola aestuarii]|uniref:LysR family transcriptional regulator n=1 Tax=Pseudooceanicola aestuarii TaxID=2697319 RepID=UPI0013D76E2B|nr:LysR family transcriptional regulator [Pseudooceanicola aestuarii]
MILPISWEDQRVFLAVLETGSLSAAARQLGLSHPTVRARIDTLERRLELVLFTRSASGLTPTPAGEALRAPARAMAHASDLFVRQASDRGAAAGVVRLSVPDLMGVEVVPALLRPLRDSHPALRIELALSNLPADVLTQEVDIAVRTVTPTQAALVAQKAGTVPLGLFAARGYIDRHGRPDAIADLARHDMIGPDRSRADLNIAQTLIARIGSDTFVLRTDSHPAQLAAARAGLGIAVTQVPVGRADPGLVHVLPDVVVARLGVWIVTHENLARVPRVRAVFDALVAGYRAMSRRAGGPE